MVAGIPDGLRHLRNFAKKRKDDVLLAEVIAFGMQKPGEKSTDYSLVT